MPARLSGIILALLLSAPFPMARAKDHAPAIDPAVLTEGFLASHPDLRWRGEGIRAYRKREYGQALDYFKRAAGYADKPSQAMVADMYWTGTGVPQDRAIAYAWMDAAAERLYPDLLALRERYWSDLDEDERVDAVARGQAIFAEYGDDAAKPRLEVVLRRAKRGATGSRLGAIGNLTIIPGTGPLADTGMTLRGDEYYAPKYWEPAHYWRLQDEIWNAPLRTRVRVGEVENVGEDGDGGPGTDVD